MFRYDSVLRCVSLSLATVLLFSLNRKQKRWIGFDFIMVLRLARLFRFITVDPLVEENTTVVDAKAAPLNKFYVMD